MHSIIIIGLLVLTVSVFTSASPIIVADEEVVDPEELSHLTTPPPSSNIYDDWEDWESWIASEEITKWFPYYRSGYDEDGRVVYIMEYGKWNFRDLAHRSEEKIEEFWKYFEQIARRAEKDAAVNGNQGTVFIVDWNGFSLASYASPKALQLSLKMFTTMVRFNNAIHSGFQINVNFSAETFVNISRPFMGTFLDKFEWFGPQSRKWKPRILKRIPASQLPPQYGGDKNWMPLPIKVKT